MKNLKAEEVISVIEKEIFPLRSTDLFFNPYNDFDPQFDKPNAAEIRQENLRSYVRSCFTNNSVKFLVIGEAPGPRGCRFSGVPFTNEMQLIEGKLKFSGKQSSNRAEPYRAPASKIFWRVMLPFMAQGNFFIWNCIPLHPHKNNQPLSIRNPTLKEIQEYSRSLSQLVNVIQPKVVIAVGRKAQEALSRINVEAFYVRHPSMGGAKEFTNRMNELIRK